MRRSLAQASLTGAFCLVFALAVDRLTEALSATAFLAASFASGFLGSLVAQGLLRPGREGRHLVHRAGREEPE
jgi:hypothetical protein